MALGPIQSTATRSPRSGFAERLTPTRAWWLGLALLAFAMLYNLLFFQVFWMLGGQDLASSAGVVLLGNLAGVAVPLGASFVVASVIAARIRRIPFSSPTAMTIAPAEEPRFPPKPSPRLAVWVGTAMIVVGLINQSFMLVQYLPQQPSIERDIALFVAPFLNYLVPLGTVLIPAAWLLGLLDNRIARPRPR